MDIKQAFTTNEHLEQHGVMVGIGNGTSLLVARMYNPAHADALKAALAPYKARPDATVPQEVTDGLLAKYILLGWEGIEENGEPVPYSVEKAMEYLAIKDFRKVVVRIADDMETYRAAAYEEAEKN